MRNGMMERKPARSDLLLQTLETALAFFATEEAGRPFRGEWRIALKRWDSGLPHAILPVIAFTRCAWQNKYRRAPEEYSRELDGQRKRMGLVL